MHKMKDSRWSCGCTGCESQRAEQVKIGSLVVPATRDPDKTNPGTIPFWSPGEWCVSGWSKRFHPEDESPLIVLSFIDRKDIENGGHLDSALLFSTFTGMSVITSKKWLRVVSSQEG